MDGFFLLTFLKAHYAFVRAHLVNKRIKKWLLPPPPQYDFLAQGLTGHEIWSDVRPIY